MAAMTSPRAALKGRIEAIVTECEEQDASCRNERESFDAEHPPEPGDEPLGPCTSCQWNMRVAEVLREVLALLSEDETAKPGKMFIPDEFDIEQEL
jgi:hypothetical protein